jgi:hypothetical protein
MITSIKRSDEDLGGLDTLFDYSARDVESERAVEVSSFNFTELMSVYERYISDENDEYDHVLFPRFVLTPNEINTFTQLTKQYFEHENYINYTGQFLNGLINSSYNANYNDFYLNLKGFPAINSLCTLLEGKSDNSVKVNIGGNVGNHFGWASKFLTSKIDGNTNYFCGYQSKNLAIHVTGNVCVSFGKRSNNLLTLIEGDCGPNFGDKSSNMEALIQGNVRLGFARESKNITAIIEGIILSTTFLVNNASNYSFITGNEENMKHVKKYPKLEFCEDIESHPLHQKITQQLEARFK